MDWFHQSLFISADHCYIGELLALSIRAFLWLVIPPDSEKVHHFYEADEAESESETK